MYRILIFRFISSHHHKLFHFLGPVLWKLGKSPRHWGRQRRRWGDLATLCGVSAENQPRTRCESHSRYISQNIGRVVHVQCNTSIVQLVPSRMPIEIVLQFDSILSNSCVPDHILKVLFDPIQFFSFRTRIGGLTRNSAHRAWSTSPSLSTSKRRQLFNWLKASKDKLMWWIWVRTWSVTSVSSIK